MSTFWSWYITALTIGTLLALFWLIFATRKGETHKSETEQTMGHAFDGIEEYDNPLPKWWFMLFIGTIVFSIGYLALYDPVTVAMHQWFRYLGASIPVIAISGASYYLAVRLIVAPMGKGNYTKGTAITSRPTLDPQPAPGAMKVSL